MINNITVNEQSSIRIESGRVLYFDPFRLKTAPHDADVIFITHSHYDHFSPEDIAKAAKPDTLFVAPASMAGEMKVLGSVTLMQAGETKAVCGIGVEAVPAYNRLKPFHPKRSGWLGYVVTIDGQRIYVCGDTDDTPEARAVSCDIVCVPIGGTYTMDAAKAAAFVNALSPKLAVPIHYGTLVGRPSDADVFESGVAAGIEVVRKISFRE